jgi:putative endopeptidase
MIKSILTTIFVLVCALTLPAQTEPQKAAPLASTTPPPNVRDASKPALGTAPVSSSAQTSASASGEATADKNAPPIDKSNFDESVKPGDDFFTYSNGSWLKRNPIPPDQSRWGSFNELIEKNNDALHEIAEKAAAEKSASPDVQKVGDFYASGMNEAEINTAGVKPLSDEMQKIDAPKDRDDLTKEIARLHDMGVNAFFAFGRSGR